MIRDGIADSAQAELVAGLALLEERHDPLRALTLGFVDDPSVELIGVEPAGGAAVGHGVPGVVHGSTSFLLQDEDGQVQEAQSVSAGLDYPGVGPEHAHLADIGRARYETVTDDEVLDAFFLLGRRFSNLAVLNDWPPLFAAAFPIVVFVGIGIALLWWIERR